LSLPTDPPLVRTRGNTRTLEFSPGMIQSEMRLSHPDQLVLAYPRAMMCFVLFQPQPQHVIMVGLGGGSLVKFCHRYLPHCRITVLELRADVIALREQFAIPPDDARLRIIEADASHYLQHCQEMADVLLIDGFDELGLPPELGSSSFYRACRRLLRPGGVLVANIFSYDPAYPDLRMRLHAAFDGQLCRFHGIAGNNHLLFAVAGRTPSAALTMQRRVARHNGLRLAWLNRLLARWIVWRLQARPAARA